MVLLLECASTHEKQVTMGITRRFFSEVTLVPSTEF
jgi:hypothetical protein